MSWFTKLLGNDPGDEEVQLAAASPYLPPSTTAQEDQGYRSLTGGGDPRRDLTPMEFVAQLRMADFLATRNPFGRRLVGIFRDMTLGDNVEYSLGKEATPAATDWVESFWTANDMEARLPRLAEGLSRTGERIVPASTDDAGRVRLGFVHPGNVKGISYGGMDDTPKKVGLRDRVDGPGKQLDVIRKYQEGDKDIPKHVDAGTWAGEVFYWYVNRSEGQARGLSDLLAIGDWIDALDELMFVGIDRAKTSLHVFFDVTLEGADEEQILRWLATAQPPKPGTLRAHNELVKWELKAPDLASAEIEKLYKVMKEHVVGTTGFPLPWFGSGEKANKASAAEMTMPTLRMLRARRAYMVSQVVAMIEYCLDEGVRKGGLSPKDRDSVTVTISVPELEDSKLGSLSQAVQQILQAMAIAVDQHWITDEIAQRVTQMLLSELGVDFDADEMKAAMDEARDAAQDAEEKAAQAAQDRARALLQANQGQQSGTPPDPVPANQE